MKTVHVLYCSPMPQKTVSLHHELILINDAIQLSTSVELGELIRYNFATEVTRCRDEMQRFLDKTKGVTATGMVGMLNKV
ncbi:hypothetical protein MVEN_00421600 [Mycena venus]|uniref:Uncharacterized protein n=1 Tax=Mycena venus TaxID=2733690 RepID=A0A8H7DBD5_9AGAR|nr:hypothetical protein MVEN_00421600 [Mycena venus]